MTLRWWPKAFSAIVATLCVGTWASAAGAGEEVPAIPIGSPPSATAAVVGARGADLGPARLPATVIADRSQASATGKEFQARASQLSTNRSFIWMAKLFELSTGTKWTSLEFLGAGFIEPYTRLGITVTPLRGNRSAKRDPVPVRSFRYVEDGQVSFRYDTSGARLGLVEYLPLEVHWLPLAGAWPRWAQMLHRWEFLSACDLYVHSTTWGDYPVGRSHGAQYRASGLLREYGLKFVFPLANVRIEYYTVSLRPFSGPGGTSGPYFTFAGAEDRGLSVGLDLTLGAYFRKP